MRTGLHAASVLVHLNIYRSGLVIPRPMHLPRPPLCLSPHAVGIGVRLPPLQRFPPDIEICDTPPCVLRGSVFPPLRVQLPVSRVNSGGPRTSSRRYLLGVMVQVLILPTSVRPSLCALDGTFVRVRPAAPACLSVGILSGWMSQPRTW